MFKKRLRLLRKKYGVTQQTLADALNLSSSTIGMYEQGRRDPDTETICALAKFFGVTTDYLLGISETPKYSFKPESLSLLCEIEELSDSSKEYLREYIRLLKLKDNTGRNNV